MTKIFAHRGSKGTHPENTMAAFKEAAKVGADGIELDVQYTKDNRLAVIHDHTVDRTTNGTGAVREKTMAELKELDAGSWFSETFRGEKIPTLEEVFEWAKDNSLHINIELKYVALDYENYEEQVIDLIKSFNFFDRVTISSFNHEGLRKIHTINQDIECGILYDARLFEPWNYAKTVGAKALHPNKHSTDPTLIMRSIEHGMSVRVFTVNEDEEIKQWISWESHAIITDYPEKARQIKEQVEQEKQLKAKNIILEK